MVRAWGRSALGWSALGVLMIACGRSPWDLVLSGSDEGLATTSAPETSVDSTATTAATSAGDTAPPACGDGTLDMGEQCDDGNRRDGDGCAADCTAESSAVWVDNDVHGLGHGVAIDPEGDIVVVGVDFEQVDEGKNAWIRKYAPDGTIRWTVSYHGGGNEEAYDVAIGPASHLFVAGTLGNDAWVGEFDGEGTFVRQFTHAGEHGGVDVAHGVALTPGGQLVAAGYEEIDPVRYTTDIWIAHWGVSGVQDWQRTIDGEAMGDDDAWAVATDAGGSIFATGFMRNLAGDRDVWVGALSPSGELLWEDLQTGRDLSRDEGLGVTVDPSGDVLVTGYLQGEPGYVGWIRRYDPAGEERWTTLFDHDGHGTDVAHAAAITSEGTLAVVGQADDGDGRIWLGSFTADGVHQWSVIEGTRSGTANDVALLPSGHAAVVGSTYEGTQTIWVSVYPL